MARKKKRNRVNRFLFIVLTRYRVMITYLSSVFFLFAFFAFGLFLGETLFKGVGGVDEGQLLVLVFFTFDFGDAFAAAELHSASTNFDGFGFVKLAA